MDMQRWDPEIQQFVPVYGWQRPFPRYTSGWGPVERIVNLASHQFYRKGTRVTGIDDIIKMADVSKATFYRHFKSKDDLILAYVEETSAHYWKWFYDVLRKYPDNPQEQLLGLVSSLAEEKMQEGVRFYRGCPFVNIIIETLPEHRAHQAALKHFQQVRERLRELATITSNPEMLANQLFALMQGITNTPCHLEGSKCIFEDAVEAATVLIHNLSFYCEPDEMGEDEEGYGPQEDLDSDELLEEEEGCDPQKNLTD